MGACSSNLTDEEIELKKKNKIIEEEIEKLKQLEDDKVKLLLLGAGESGKSTIFKQMKVIYGEKYTDDERKRNIPLITSNIIQSIQQLCEQAVLFNLEDKIQAKTELAIVSELKGTEDCLTESTGNAVLTLWKDPGIQEVWTRRSEFHIIESVQYYFNKLDEIKLSTYLPSDNDILMVRVRTSGIVTERYIIDDTVFEMYDVGGQRNERKKWIHCFEGVTAVIFIAALSEYDQQLFEDVSQNRMVEALDLFSDICNNVYFENSSMILFLNKKDLFETKIFKKNIKDQSAFADFKGRPNHIEDGKEYFISKFLEKNKNPDRSVFVHATCATDTRNVTTIFNACKDIILKENLRSSGFME